MLDSYPAAWEDSISSHHSCTNGDPASPPDSWDGKLWERPDCYHCQIQFPPPTLPSASPQCPSVLETVRSRLSIFRQGLCWSGVSSHRNCQLCPSFSSSSVVRSLMICKAQVGLNVPWNGGDATLPPHLLLQGWLFLF